MPTIRQIAEIAGVSRGTVDRVLNHRGSVNPQTAERVLAIAKQLDYKPNRAGLVLAAQKKNIRLGVILFGKGNPFFDEVVSGIRQAEEELADYNCDVLLRWTSVSTARQIEAIDELLGCGVTGFAISPTNDPELAGKINELYEQNIPVVTLNTDIRNCKRLAFVGSNYYQTGSTAAGLMRLIAGAGRKDIYVGIVSGSEEILCHTERIAGFQAAVSHEKRIHIVETITNDDDDDTSYERTLKMLEDHPEINALFFAASGIYGGCKAVLDKDRAKDCTIITYDAVSTTRELLLSDIISATICQQPRLQGSLPLEILFSYLAAGQAPKQELNYTTVDIRIKENIDS